MYPTISHLIDDLFGIYIPLPIQTFGFFVAISFLLAAYTLHLEFKRKEQLGFFSATERKVLKGARASAIEMLTSALIGFILGFKLIYALLNYSEFASRPQAVILSSQGNFIGGLLVAALAAWWKYREKEKQRLPEPKWLTETVRPHDHIGNITIYAAVFGFSGAKLFHLLENPSEIINLFDSASSLFSGLTMYGGLICAAASIYYYCRKNSMKFIHVADAAAPGLMLAYGFGRLGCHFSGDGDWGLDNLAPVPGWLSFFPDWLWSYNYPHNVIHAGIPIPGCEGTHCYALENPVWPTPLYEAIVCIGLFFTLWACRNIITVPGRIFSVYLILNGIERLLIEQIRINEVYTISGMHITQAEIIAAGLIIAGITGFWLSKKLR